MSENCPSMPTSLKIGCFVYRVKLNEDLEDMGLCNSEKLVIEINPNYPHQVQRETLLHECLHALFHDSFVVETKDEEKIVRTISPKIMQVILDNPELKSFLFD